MRLIIVENQVHVLRKIREIIEKRLDKIEIIMVCCNAQEKSADFLPGNVKWYNACTEEELYTICEKELQICEGDHYLLDITLFGESQMDKKFSDYISVKLANYISNKEVKDVKIMFYTYPLGISRNDFANETVNWGKPIYRPYFDKEDLEEKEAQKDFGEAIERYCKDV